MPWIDLAPYDVDERDLLAVAFATITARVPDWRYDPTSIEAALLEAFAAEVAEGVYATHRLARAVFRGALRLLGTTISDGAQARGVVRFTAFDTAGYTVPIGTVLRYRSTTARPVELFFRTTSAAVIPTGSTWANASVICTEATGLANGIAVDTALEMVDSMGWVRSVAVLSAPADGADPETEDDYLSRGAATLARLTDTLATPTAFETFAVESPAVERARALNATEPGGAVGGSLGHITVLVTAAGGTAVSEGERSSLAATMTAASRADLLVHVDNATVVDVPVSAVVRRLTGYQPDAVRASCTDALAAYLDADTWTFGHDVEPNELIEVLGRDTVGVDVVVEIVSPVSTVAIGDNALARLGTVTITVVDP